MGETNGLPRVNEAVAFLDSFAPDAAQALRERGGQFGELLEAGMIGGEQAAGSADAERAGLAARAQVLIVALDRVGEQCSPIAQNVLNRLTLARRVQFAAAALAALSSSGVIASAGNKWATIIAGVLALLSSVAGLFADMVVLGGQGRYDKLRDAAQSLIRGEGMAMMARANIAAVAATDFAPADMVQLIQQGNVLFADIMQALADAKL